MDVDEPREHVVGEEFEGLCIQHGQMRLGGHVDVEHPRSVAG